MVELFSSLELCCPVEVPPCRALFVLCSSTFMHNTTQGIFVEGPDPAAGSIYKATGKLCEEF